MVVCLFATSENGVVIQDSFAMSPILNRIIGMDTPYFFFMKKVNLISQCNNIWSLRDTYSLKRKRHEYSC